MNFQLFINEPVHRTHLSSGRPYRAEPKADGTTPEDDLKPRRLGTILRVSSGGLLGPVLVALDAAL